MPRPIKCRKVEFFPKQTLFKPAGKKGCTMEQITVKVEELEAMRLKDIEGLNQNECAIKMGVSRQTFQNIIDSARNKVAIALTEGKAINISGGNYISSECKFQCAKCGELVESKDKHCTLCKSSDILCNRKSKKCHK
ncbi:DUF134 domain-containing protein [Proteinivorax hydrogeniformans]|uniref:UPF0251 protein PRVXH_000242 n=1 Tax=Proteinivorax hydrogeniformans TaxID=1826727 RepID=A0AAU8HUA5_9FIRM